MNEFYVEQLIPGKKTGKSLIFKIIMIVLTVVALLATFIGIPFAMMIAAGLLFADFMLLSNTSVEYEYLYLNGDLDIDRVVGKQRRKHMYSTSVNNMQVIAPVGSQEILAHHNIKTIDYSSGRAGEKVYMMIVTNNGNKEGILIEPNDKILHAMQVIAPRKVVL